MADRKLTVKLIGDSSQLERVFGRTGSAASSMGSKIGSVFGTLAKGGALLGAGLGAALFGAKNLADSASDLGEAQSKANAIFGEGSAAIEAFGKTAAKELGLSNSAATDFASGFGGMFKNSGFGGSELTDMSKDFVALTADLGSFNNMAEGDVFMKLRAGLGGEAEGLKDLNIFMNAAMVETRALEMGLADVNGEISEGAKVQARAAIIMEQSADAHGDFAKTSDGLANQQKKLGAQWENMKATLGQKLAPVFANFMGMVSEKMPAVVEWIGPKLTKAFEFASAWVKANWPQISETVTAVMGKVRAAIEFVVGWVRDNWPQISETARAVFDSVREVVSNFVEMVQAFWARFGDTIIETLRAAWEIIKTVVTTAVTVISEVFAGFKALFEGDWSALWESVKTIAVTLWEGIKSVLSDAWTGLKNVAGEKFGEMKDAIVGKWDDLKGWISGQAGALKDSGAAIIQGMWDGAKGVFVKFANWLIEKVNWALGALNWLPGVDLQVPGFITDGMPEGADVGALGGETFLDAALNSASYGGSTSKQRPREGGDIHIHTVGAESAAAATQEALRIYGPGVLAVNGAPS